MSISQNNEYNPAYSMIVDAMLTRLSPPLRDCWNALVEEYRDAIADKAIQTVRDGTGSGVDVMNSDDDIAAVGTEMYLLVKEVHSLVYQGARQAANGGRVHGKAVIWQIENSMKYARDSKSRKTRHNIRRALGMDVEADGVELSLQYQAEQRDESRIINEHTGRTAHDAKNARVKRVAGRTYGLTMAIRGAALQPFGLTQQASPPTLPADHHGRCCPLDVAESEVASRFNNIRLIRS